MRFSAKLTMTMIAIVMLMFGLVYAITDETSSRMIEATIRDNLEDNARHTMDKLDILIFERLADIKMIASDPIVSSRDSTPEEITKRLTELKEVHKVYSSLSFFDMNGVRLADTEGISIGVQHQMVGYWKDILKGEISCATDIRYSKELDSINIYFASIVADPGGRPLGVVVSRMPVEDFSRMVDQSAGAIRKNDKIFVDLVDKDGLILYSNYREGAVLKDRIDINSPRFESEQGMIMIKAAERGYLDFKGNGWVLFINISKDRAYASLYKFRKNMVLYMLPIFLISVFIVFLFSRGFTRPILKLKKAVSDIGLGQYDTHVEIKSNDEIGELAKGFNAMAEDLKISNNEVKDLLRELSLSKDTLEDYSKTLEKKVEERAKELNDSILEVKGSHEIMLSILEDTVEAKESLERALRDLQEKEEQLVQAGKLSGIGEMAAGIAHEINNPLTSILGFAQLIMSKSGIDPELLKDLGIIEREAKRCVNIISELLNFAKPKKTDKAPLNVNDMVRATMQIVRYAPEMDRVEITEEFGSDLPLVNADPQQLQQVFMNIILNALHAMPVGGRLTIRTAVEGSSVVTIFTDTGIGIQNDIKDKIFEPFFTTAYHSGRKGTGLGLSICFSIIKEHGGRIEFNSEEGKGSTFKVILPATI